MANVHNSAGGEEQGDAQPTALAVGPLARISLQKVTGAAHMRFCVNTPAEAAPPSATMRAMSALGPDALKPPAMPAWRLPTSRPRLLHYHPADEKLPEWPQHVIIRGKGGLFTAHS